MVTTVYPYIARGAGGRRGREPQVSGAGGIYSAARGGNLFLTVSREPVVQQDHSNRARGDGPDRAGVLFAGAASAGDLGSQRALGVDGGASVPVEGSQGRGYVPGYDGRRGHDVDRAEGVAQLQAAAADLVSDRAEVSR